jgi:UDPglucose 6-dehydrogenase
LEEGANNAEVIYIAVGTPPSADSSPDLSYVKAAAKGIGRAIVSNTDAKLFRVIVNKSTVPLGSGNWVEMLVREEMRQLVPQSPNNDSITNGNGQPKNTAELNKGALEEIFQTFSVVSNPEFLREGTAIGDTFYPDRIVVGANNEKAFDVLRNLYQPLLNQNFTPPASIAPRPDDLKFVPLVTTDLTSAEMIKYAANSFLAMKISFANEMANICEQTGADVKQVAEGIGLDQRIGSRFLNAGIGWGGSCFGKDVSALIEIAREYSYEPQLLVAAREVNARQRQIVIQKLQSTLRIIKGKTIGLLGLAFKPDTDDVRDAPSYDIASALIKMGAYVKVYDPIAMEAFQSHHPALEVTYTGSAQELSVDCDALVVVTEWDEFRQLDLNEIYQLMKGSVLIDGRNIFEPQKASELGFKYLSIGRELPEKTEKSEGDLLAQKTVA